ncbi:FecR family protein [Flavobacterium beibuense]|nr:FecR family protein [Flavobacterium beibuense]
MMIKKVKHYLENLIEKSTDKTASQKEEQLLENFVQHEYSHNNDWDETTMGNKDDVNNTIYGKINDSINSETKVRKLWPAYLKYSAAACVVAAAGAFFFLKNDPQAKMLAIQTTNTMDSLKLGDGSTIFLAANSQLSYPESFTGDERNVTLLQGNAFFKVAKDPSHPFVIKSGDIKTKVLGTSFHIKLCKENCNVTVVTGKVNVSSAGESVDLLPNEEAVYNNNKLTKQVVSQTILADWYKEDIELNDVKLEEVFTLLRYKYGVTVDLKEDEILNTRLTVYIKNKASLDSILEQINYITNQKFKAYDDIIKTTK